MKFIIINLIIIAVGAIIAIVTYKIPEFHAGHFGLLSEILFALLDSRAISLPPLLVAFAICFVFNTGFFVGRNTEEDD